MTLRLFLAELEAFDPHPIKNGVEWRFLCPFCGQDKPRNDAHRCFNVNTQSGPFFCQRCSQRGKLADFWTDRPKMNRREFARQQLQRVCELHSIGTPLLDPDEQRKVQDRRERFENLPLVENTPGVAYLLGRGISLEIARAADVRFSTCWMPEPPQWEGRTAVVFPIHDQVGELVATQGRYTDEGNGTKTKTHGPKSKGVFTAAGAFDVPPFILTEAPIDALSLAVAGFPGVALCGTTSPGWLPKFCFGRTVFLGFDADEAGDRAATNLTPLLESFGAACKRLRPNGAKDWNEFLCRYKREALANFVNHAVFLRP